MSSLAVYIQPDTPQPHLNQSRYLDFHISCSYQQQNRHRFPWTQSISINSEVISLAFKRSPDTEITWESTGMGDEFKEKDVHFCLAHTTVIITGFLVVGVLFIEYSECTGIDATLTSVTSTSYNPCIFRMMNLFYTDDGTNLVWTTRLVYR